MAASAYNYELEQLKQYYLARYEAERMAGPEQLAQQYLAMRSKERGISGIHPENFYHAKALHNSHLGPLRARINQNFERNRLALNQRYIARAAKAAATAAPIGSFAPTIPYMAPSAVSFPQSVATQPVATRPRPTPQAFTFSPNNVAQSRHKNHSYVHPTRNVHRTNVPHPNARGGTRKQRTTRRMQKRRTTRRMQKRR